MQRHAESRRAAGGKPRSGRRLRHHQRHLDRPCAPDSGTRGDLPPARSLIL